MPRRYLEEIKESCEEYEDIPRALLLVLWQSVPNGNSSIPTQRSEQDMIDIWDAFINPAAMKDTKTLFHDTYHNLGRCYPWQATMPLARETWMVALCAAALQLPVFLKASREADLSPLEHQRVVRAELRNRFVGEEIWDGDARYEDAFRMGRGLAHHVVAPVESSEGASIG